jgi:phosphoribosylformylglycinamidine cyclo-ligase
MNNSLNYKSAGVDVEEGYKAVELIKKHAAKTFTENVLTGLGSFGAMYEIGGKYENPVLVSGTDGVGTKLKLAFMTGIHDTVGIDLVAMCANDILCHGAKPLFFLDYFATGKLKAEVTAKVVAGIANGCVSSGASLVGGETAEMPGFYDEDEYDLAGFCVGIVDKHKIINGSNICSRDKLIGIASSGIHSNGFSLVRKVFFDILKHNPNDYIEELGCKLYEELMKPTKIYVKPVLELIENFEIKGISHITGGGFFENIPRMIPQGLGINIKLGTWDVPKVFDIISRDGNVDTKSMFNTFNMGIGLVLAVKPEDADRVADFLESKGEKSYIIGEVIEGQGVTLQGEHNDIKG